MKRIKTILFCIGFSLLCVWASPLAAHAAESSNGVAKPGEGSYTMGEEKENDRRGKMGTDFYVYIVNQETSPGTENSPGTGNSSGTGNPPGSVHPGTGSLPKTGRTGQTAESMMLLALFLGAGYLLSDSYEKKIKTRKML